ncbi:MAG TPA: DNA alkylation repair protein [Gemmatimonadaceae bacterium]
MARKRPASSAKRQPSSSVQRPKSLDVLRRMRELADPRRAVISQRFFKSGAGQYGAGDKFLGLTVPQIRALSREIGVLPLPEIEKLLESDLHEARLLALILLTSAYRRGDAKVRERIYRLYLRRTDRINNWDLVDLSAPNIVGAHLLDRSRAPLRTLARSKSLWERRIAVVATQHLIQQRQFDDTLELAELLLGDEEDLMHKAVGWMLREVGKRDERTLVSFLDKHAGAMPRTALRYAIERLSPAQRRRYMETPRSVKR